MRIINSLAVWTLLSTSISAAEVIVKLGGTALDGGPAFEISFGDEIIGRGTVDPVPPPGEGMPFTFDVSDSLLESGENFVIRLINDKYEEGVGDRNLVVYGATVGSIIFTQSDFRITVNNEPTGQTNGFLGRNISRAIASAPQGGWLAPAETPSASAETIQAVVPTSESTAQPPLSSPICDAIASVEAFGNNAKSLTDAQKGALDAVLEQVRTGNCAVEITGYASIIGPESVNLAVSKIRAEAVLSYLVEAGAKFTKQTIVGAGGTDQFGPAYADNRRVEVQVFVD